MDRCTAESREYGMAPCLLDLPGRSFLDYQRRSHTPLQPPFHFEHLGLTVEELVPRFNAMIGDSGDGVHANCSFIVLDEQTLHDGSCCCVSLLADVQTLRADFVMAIEVLGAAEINLETLDEGAYTEFYEKGKTVTVEAWRAQERRWEEERAARKKKAQGWPVQRTAPWDV